MVKLARRHNDYWIPIDDCRCLREALQTAEMYCGPDAELNADGFAVFGATENPEYGSYELKILCRPGETPIAMACYPPMPA